MKIAADSVVVASGNPLSSDVAGETILTSLARGHYYALNAVGARVWQLIAAPVVVRDVCATIAAEYDVDLERCTSDVVALLEELRAEGFIETR